jgi:hypothetical protein
MQVPGPALPDIIVTVFGKRDHFLKTVIGL